MIRRPFGVASIAALAGCTQAPPPVQQLAMFDGEIVANSPAGYCVDPASSKPEQGFAVMAPCVSLGSAVQVPNELAVATVQIGPTASGAVVGAEPEFREFLTTESGAALLSAEGAAEDVTVIDAVVLENSVAVHFSDSAPPLIAGLQSEEWRAFTDINGRLVTVAVRGLSEAPLEESAGSWLLNLILTGLLSTTDAISDDGAEA